MNIRSWLMLSVAVLAVPASGAPGAGQESVGSGGLYVRTPEGYVALPVVSMAVELEITGVLARGTVRQSFTSAARQPAGAVYMFPLPERAAVDGMQIRIGSRTIEAVVREREVARLEFEEARRAGRQASLLEQHRPNLFRTSVANIAPGDTIEVALTYVQELDVDHGRFGLAFPLTFTPRYSPRRACSSGAGPDICRDAEAEFGYSDTDLPAMPRATLTVRVDAGLPIVDLRSASHPIRAESEGQAVRVAVRSGEFLADRDFLLSWSVERADGPRGSLWIEERGGERYGLLMLAPPLDDGPSGSGLPTETVFVVDTSGSMAGPSIEQARQSVLAALSRLRTWDRFALIRFSDTSRGQSRESVPAGPAEVDEARRWVQALEAGGGTEILGALRHGLSLLEASASRLEQRLVLITDGAVANESELFTQLAPHLDRVRLHVVGIGAAPNRYLMRKLARVGRGSCAFIHERAGLLEELDGFLQRIDRPVLADIALDWPDGHPLEVYPDRLPDLHAGEFTFISLKLAPGRAVRGLTLGGRSPQGWLAHELGVVEPASAGSGVATRWARAKIESLLDGLHEGRSPVEVRPAVVEVASAFNLVTPFTSLVAVERTRSAGEPGPLLPVAAVPAAGVQLPIGGSLGPLRLLGGASLLTLALLGWVVDRWFCRARWP